MSLFRRLATVGAVSVALASTGIALPSLASAAGTPPWQPGGGGTGSSAPDANNIGTIAFYDASGAAKTTGSTTSAMAKYVQAVSGTFGTSGSASLFFYTPNSGTAPGGWSGSPINVANTYPVASAPGALGTSTRPVSVEDTTNDLTLDDYLTNNFPNGDANASYQGIYEIRLFTADGTGHYASADVSVSGTTWTQVFPTSVAATTVSMADVSSPITYGAQVQLTATVTPAATAGSVQFKDNGSPVGAAAAVDTGTSHATTTITPAGGSHSYTATFTPTSPTFSPSDTAAAVPLTVNPAATTVTLSSTPAGTATAGTSITLSAVATAGVAGSVTFSDNGASFGSAVPVSTADGKASATVRPTVGAHSYTAAFAPTDTASHAGSNTSTTPVTLTVSKASPAVTVVITPGSAAFGAGATAKVTVTAPGVTPTGSVTLTAGATPVGTVALSAGSATFALPKTLPAGAQTLTATYSGDANLNTGSATGTMTVTKAKVTFAVKLAKASIKHTAHGVVSVTLEGTGFVPSGKVQVLANGKLVGTGTLKNGAAKVTVKTLKKGSYRITVKYLGTANVAAGVSKAVTLKTT